MEFLQENCQIQKTNITLDNTPRENHVRHQQSPCTQIPEVNRQKESVTRKHVPEAQDTFMQSWMRKTREQAVNTTADINESAVVSDKQGLP